MHRLEEAHAQLLVARKQLAPTDPEVIDRLTWIAADVEELVTLLEAMEDDTDRYAVQPNPEKDR